jgi:hypothetical protein
MIKTDYEEGTLQPTPAGHPQLATPRANYFLLVFFKWWPGSRYIKEEEFNFGAFTLLIVITANVIIMFYFFWERWLAMTHPPNKNMLLRLDSNRNWR